MPSTATLEKTNNNVTVDIYDTRITLRVDQSLERSTLSTILERLRRLDGVSSIDYDSYYALVVVSIYTVEEFVDTQEVARVAGIIMGNTIAETEPVKVKMKLNRGRHYLRLETDFRHTDGSLLLQLEKLGLYDLVFQEGGYNIAFQTNGQIPMSDLGDKLEKAINDFYAGMSQPPQLDYIVASQTGTTTFTLLLSRRIPQEFTDGLVVELKDQILGLVSAYFERNNHVLYVERANSFFPENKMALQVGVLLEELFEKIDAA